VDISGNLLMQKQQGAKPENLCVCYFGTYRANYERNRWMIERLRRQNVTVKECHATLWQGLEDREQIAGGGWLKPAFWGRFLLAYARLLLRYFRIGAYDLMVIGYPGQPDVPLGWLLTRLRRKPLVWDIFMSIHLISLERQIDSRSAISSRLIRTVEKISLSLPDSIIVDTPVYSEWYQKEYKIDPKKIRLLPTGADDRVFQPQAERSKHTTFRCLYYGTYIPNHGVKYIVEAARLLSDRPEIQFIFVGTGPEKQQIEALVSQYELSSITFHNWMAKNELIEEIRHSDVLLGTFGVTPQALMTMQHKIHEGLAMAKPIINGDSPLMRRTLTHKKDIFLCERENPQSLAEAILVLYQDADLREQLAINGFSFYKENYAFDKLGAEYAQILLDIVNDKTG
jgi:glycosyltransferase involved in cell wall biosynthesis